MRRPKPHPYPEKKKSFKIMFKMLEFESCRKNPGCASNFDSLPQTKNFH